MNLRFAFILTLLSFSIIMAQKKYYVSNDGNDSSDGLTESTAWKTIGKVNSQTFSATDVVAFKRGSIFNDAQLTIDSDGASGNPIVFTAYGNGNKPVIGNKSSDWVETIAIKGNYVTLDNLTIYGTSSGTYMKCNGVGIYNDHITIENCYLEGGVPNTDNLSNTLHRKRGVAIRININSFTDIRISDSEIAYWGLGINIYKPNGIIIEKTKFHQMHMGDAGYQNGSGGNGGIGIMFSGSDAAGGWDCNYNVIVRNCEFYDYERWGIAMSSMSNMIVEKNVFHHNLDERVYSGGVRHGNAAKLHDRRAGNVKGDGSIGNIFRYNVSHDLGRHQTSDTYNSDHGNPYTISWYGCVTGGSGLDYSVHNNLFYNCGGGLAEMADANIEGEVVSSPNFWAEVYNNTCYNISTDVLSSASIKLEVDHTPVHPPQMKFKNNIIFDGYVTTSRPVAAIRENFHEGNNIITNNVDYYFAEDNKSPSVKTYIWERWNKGHTIEGDATLLNTDPNFSNIKETVFLSNIGVAGVTVPDFRLLNNLSPAYNGGTNVGNDPSGFDISVDLLGNLRTTNDVGALGIASTGNFTPQLPEIPIIIQQPENKRATENENIKFSTTATCNDEIGYQWWKYPYVSISESKISNTLKYSGATTNSLIINNVNSSDNNTKYVCEIYNTKDPSNRWVNSEITTLTITSNSLGANFNIPIITSQPKSIIVNKNEDAKLKIDAICDDDIGYQWWKSPFISESESKIVDNSKFLGTTTNQLVIKNVQDTDAHVSYVCEVYNKIDRINLKTHSDIVGLTMLMNNNTKNSISEIKVLLEGPFKNNGMRTFLNEKDFLPKAQPFKIPPFNYSLDQKVDLFNNNIVDWILVELRSNENSIAKQFAALLRNDGIVLNSFGFQDFTNQSIEDGDYYLVIHHRNHLSIMSKNKISVINSVINYDFSTSIDQAYGTNSMVELANGNFAMYSGNGDANKIINKLDFGSVANNILTTGYEFGDIDMNGIINVLDYSNINKNISVKSNVP